MAAPVAQVPVQVLERCKTDRLLVKPGRNLWIIARTDKDAASAGDVITTAGAFLLRVLGYASPSGYDRTEIIQDPAPPPGALAAWYIGAARPALVVRVTRTYPVDASDGSRLGRSIECDAVRFIDADQPWYVVVEFDWRGPLTWISWPASKVSALGIRSSDTRRTDLDWLVVESWFLGAARLPDSTLGGEIVDFAGEKVEAAADKIKEIATSGAKSLAVVAAVTVAVLLAFGYARRGKS